MYNSSRPSIRKRRQKAEKNSRTGKLIRYPRIGLPPRKKSRHSAHFPEIHQARSRVTRPAEQSDQPDKQQINWWINAKENNQQEHRGTDAKSTKHVEAGVNKSQKLLLLRQSLTKEFIGRDLFRWQNLKFSLPMSKNTRPFIFGYSITFE